ncbi:SEC-C motif-containing protein [Desulfobaculum xiamenense]|uniref:SEC-C motif-containing protein n=1 Tax=Desulfobaculum xiamenense TaxID=995050 RepID=A0A846QS22_9BACT|nr:YchJ family protein [Desulfobaculum xiamenense]NJB69332.1 SEC-C motif-containing protein [Desulfobaculum xiamenense]
MSIENCPCGSGRAYAECCEPHITGATPAPTAEALMRARYTAFSVGALDYLHDTLSEKKRHLHDPEAVKQWAETSTWLGLEVHGVMGGGENDETGEVDFTATFEQKGVRQQHSELSQFHRENGLWVYADGRVRGNPTVRREEPKIGRNDPCPCGSGRKYKKCCGR